MFLLRFLIEISVESVQSHDKPSLDSQFNPRPLESFEVSRTYAQKLLKQFGTRDKMKMKDFERLITVLEGENAKSCVDGLKILKDIESEPEKPENLTRSFMIDVEHMITVCPTLLYHIAISEPMTSQCEVAEVSLTKRESRANVWFYSTVALVGISLCGLFGVAVIPIIDKNYYFYVLQYFMALAVGTLTGDALLHLLPHSMRPSEDMTRPELLKMMINRGIAVLSGILIFCLVERVLKMVTGLKNHKEPEEESSEIEKLNKNSHGHSHGINDSGSDSLSSIVWMVILGDGLHNFTDGMAIGAAFSNNIAGGFSTSVAVFCHELPHELGDFAVLLKAGMSARKAIYYNILSSILGFLGMCVGIQVGNTPETTQWIFAAAAGLFIYIALVDMVRVRLIDCREFR